MPHVQLVMVLKTNNVVVALMEDSYMEVFVVQPVQMEDGQIQKITNVTNAIKHVKLVPLVV